MNIAIIGLGGIGSTFAFQLARAGHQVTAIARGQRLEQLSRDQAIVTTAGERAEVRVAGSLDPTVAFDLVLVTVLAPQVDAVLPSLQASAAKTVMFMFNTFEPFARLREAVGPRFAFGFPAILANVQDAGRLESTIVTRGQITTVTDGGFAEVFTQAGIASVVHPDMESWLRTHAAMVVPFMIAVGRAHERRAGLSWSESWKLANALDEGLGLVKKLGNAITPAPMVVLSCLPRVSTAALLWSATRVSSLRKSGAAGMKEPRALIDSMHAVAPGGALPKLLAVRPD
ncbi:MAG: 2-dehydropantoate 2-reductase N-terminal domain-containing protein [Archangium sp.]